MNQEFQCVKIKDGLYIGNIVAAHDYQFLMSNKFGFVVNCSSQIPNVFQHENNIKYLKFKLVQNKTHKLWDQTLKKLNKLQRFLQQAEQHSLCCLIHSFHGHNRNIVFVIGYLMKKYQWRLKKCIAFLKSKQVFVNLSNHYISQLEILQQILTKQSILSLAWTPPYINSQEQILSKTYLNSLQCNQTSLVALKNQQSSKKKSQKRVVWLDRYQKKKAKQQQLLRKQQQKQKELQQQKQKISFLKQKQKQPRLSKQKPKKKSKQSQNLKQKTSTHIETQKVKNYSINYQPSVKNVPFNYNDFLQQEKEKSDSGKKNKRKYDLKLQEEQYEEEQQNQRQNCQSNNDSSNIPNQKEEKNIYQLTINNFISPNFNIINKTDNLIQKKSKKQQRQPNNKPSNKTSQSQSIKFMKQQKPKNKQKNKDKINSKKSVQKIKRAQSQKQVTNIRQFKQLKDLILKEQYLNNYNNNKDNSNNNSSNKKQKQKYQVLNLNKDSNVNSTKDKEKKSLNTHNNKIKDKDIRKQLKKQIQKVQKEKASYSTNSLHLIYPITNLAQNLIKNQQNQQKRSVTPTRKQRKK